MYVCARVRACDCVRVGMRGRETFLIALRDEDDNDEDT
jgi:hypothetical protein